MTVVVNSQQASASTATAATTQAITPTGIVAGRSLILLIGNAGGGATGTVTGVADTSGSNVWTLASPPNGGVTSVPNTKIAVAYVHNCAAPGTITATMGSIGSRKLLLLEVTGLQNTAHDIAGQDITAAASTGNVAPSVAMTAADWCVALVNRGGTADPTGVTAGWTLNTTGLPDNTAPILRAAWQEFAASGASGTCTFTFAASLQAGLGMIAFKVTPPSGMAGLFGQLVSGAEDLVQRTRSFFTPPRIPATVYAQASGVPYVPPPDPAGASARLTPPPLSQLYASSTGSRAVFDPDRYGADASFTPPLLPGVLYARQLGVPYVPPPDPYGASARLTPPLLPSVLYARQLGVPYVFPSEPYGARAALTPPLLPTLLYAAAMGRPDPPPPDPAGGAAYLTPPLLAQLLRANWMRRQEPGPAPELYGAQAFTPYPAPVVFTTPSAASSAGSRAVFELDRYGAAAITVIPLLPSTIPASTGGSRAVFQPDAYGAAARGTYTPNVIPAAAPYAWVAGSRAAFPADPYGAAAWLTPPLLPTLVIAGAAGSRAVFPPEAYGAAARTTPPLLPTVVWASSAGSRAVFPPDPSGAAARFTPPLLAQLLYAAAAGNRAQLEADRYGAAALTPPVTPQVIAANVLSQLSAGSRAQLPPDLFGGNAYLVAFAPATLRAGQAGVPYVPPADPYGADAQGVYRPNPVRRVIGQQGSAYRGELEHGVSLVFLTPNTGLVIVTVTGAFGTSPSAAAFEANPLLDTTTSPDLPGAYDEPRPVLA